MYYLLSYYFADEYKPKESGDWVDCLEEIRLVFIGVKDGWQIAAKAESIKCNSLDIQNQLIYLEFKAKLSIYLGRFSEALAIVKQMKSLISEDSSEDLKWLPYSVEACLFWYEGKCDLALEKIEYGLKILNKDSKCYIYTFLEYAQMLLIDCQLKSIKDTVLNLNRDTTDVSIRDFTNIILYLESINYCDEKKAEEYSNLINLNSSLFKYFQNTILEAERLFLILQYNMGKRSDSDILSDSNLPENKQILVYYYLLKKDPDSANHALRSIDQIKFLFHETNDFSSYLPIRVALALGDSYLAKTLIDKRNSLKKKRFLDFLFLARAEYLEGNTEKAFNLFNKVYENCLASDAIGRLEFEMDLSSELKNRDCRLFWENTRTIISNKATNVSSFNSNIQYEMLGESPELKTVYESIRKYGPIDLPILIIGETGTGKELTARALHKESKRKDKPFLAINCGAISETLLQSELFGHVQGAFTGAIKDKIGILEEAAEGTVFLDEIGEITPAVQVALLRVLENNEIRSVGGSIPRKLKCRIIAATNAPLQELVDQNKFRKDLLYRLQRFQVTLPPLRSRIADISALALHYLTNGREEREIKVSDQFIKCLENYYWPGNIRELRNEMEKLVLLNPNQDYFTENDLPPKKFGDFGGDFSIKEINESSQTKVLEVNTDEQLNEDEENNSKNWENMPDSFGIYLNFKNSTLRRKDRLKKVFLKYKNLSRGEVARVMNLALNTAAKDLAELEKEGFIIRIRPSSAPRTHYFALNQNIQREV